MRARTRPAPLKTAIYDQIARLGQAAASPRRLELLDLLSQGPRTVEALAHQAGRSVATTSHHLQVLRRARLAEAEKAGLYVTYRLRSMPSTSCGGRASALTAWNRVCPNGVRRGGALKQAPTLTRADGHECVNITANGALRMTETRLRNAADTVRLRTPTGTRAAATQTTRLSR